MSYFAWHWNLSGNRRCPPSEEMIGQLTPFLERIGWPKANTESNDLRLAERVRPSGSLAKGLAEIGFLEWIPPSTLQGADSRPYARQLLAEQAKFAMPWSEAAFREIDGDSRLGTSATYLAIATKPEIALPKVQQLMSDKLHRSHSNQTKAYTGGGDVLALKPDDANRLIELGYALARAGSEAERYSDPIIAMLDVQIARPSPPFGLMAAKPTEFCRIAFHIGGRPANVAKSKFFCSPTFKGGDGAPRNF